MKRNAAKPFYDAAGGRVLPDGSNVDFVLFLPGDHFEIVDDDEFEDAAREDELATEDTSVVHLLRPVSWLELEHEADERAAFDRAPAYEQSARYDSHAARGLLLDDEDDELDDMETIPEPQLDSAATRVSEQPGERTWWEAARRGLRIRPDR